MGVAISRIWGSGVQYTGDSITGLSAEDKKILADSFNELRQDLSKSGERLFLIYFEYNPDNKKYFRDFKNKSIDELKNNPKLVAHATNVMCTINGFILQLNEPEVLVQLIKKVGLPHGKRHIEDQAFDDLKIAFSKLLEEKLKNKYTDKVKKVWSNTFDVIISVFKEGMKEGVQEKSNA